MAQDYSRLHRLLRLLHLIHEGRAGNAASLAERLDVDERSVYRDLKVLRDIGVSISFDEHIGGYRVGRDSFLPPLHLTGAEALALAVLAEGVAGNEQITQTGAAARAMEKVRAQLPGAVQSELCELDGRIGIQLPATGPAGEAIRDVFDQVRQAIRDRRLLLCRYESLSPEPDGSVFELRPYALSFDQRAWYVVGHHGGRGEVRRLKLNRFTSIQLTDRPYAIPDGFSLSDYRGNAWRMIRGEMTYAVTIHFDAEVAETVADTNWHPTQQIEEHPDGSILFRCEVDGLDELVWWVLGYGPHAKVVEPAELAEWVQELVQATAKRYASP